MAKKPINKSVFKRLFHTVKSFWPVFLVAALGNVMYSGADAYVTYLFRPLLDKGFLQKDTSFLEMLPLIIIGIFIVRGIGSFVGAYAIGWIGRKIVWIFRRQIFDHLLVLPAYYYDATVSGKLLSKLTYNVELITMATGNAVTTMVREGGSVVFLLGVMFYVSWKLSLIILVVGPPIAILFRFISKRFRTLSKRIQDAMGDISHIAEETITGYREVRIFEGQDHQRKQFHKVVDYNFAQGIKIIFADAVSSPLIQLLGALVLAIVIYVALGGGKHLMISPGSFAALLAAMIAISRPMQRLTRVNNQLQQGIAAAESIYELLDEPVENNTGTRILDTVAGEVVFQNVAFCYQQTDLPVLTDINLTIKPNQSIALVGRSGSGKSTLVSLLSGFYRPVSGHVTLDGIDICDIELHNLRSHIALVSQHVTLFEDSIFNNIAYGCQEKVTEQEVIDAAKAAHAWEFIKALPEGLQTRVGENGLNLSGGQRQRVAIARAILKDAPILILDEATSALDNESERAVQSALETLQKDRTTIIVAHRLSTIENADQIVVMEQGEIKEMGSHKALMQQKGIYAQLHQSAEM